MPKHSKKRHRSRSAEDDGENKRLRRKLAEIQKRIELIEHRNRNKSVSRTSRHSDRSSRDVTTQPLRGISPGENVREGEGEGDDRSDISVWEEREDGISSVANWVNLSETSITNNIPVEEKENFPPEPELSPDILEILGEESAPKKEMGPPIQKEIASRWSSILQGGLKEEDRKSILEKYPPPENCLLLKPPELNLEVKAAVSESVIRRDGRLRQLQEPLAAAATSIGLIISGFLKEAVGDNREYLKMLSDAGRLLVDVLRTESLARRELITLNLNKELKGTLTDVPIDELLFGKDLDERLKANNNLERSSASLRMPKKMPKPTAKPSNIGRPLNSSSLPRPAMGAYRGRRPIQLASKRRERGHLYRRQDPQSSKAYRSRRQ